MSFSSLVKQELSAADDLAPCCRHAMCYGMLLFGKSFTGSSVSSLAELKSVIELYAALLLSETGCKAKISRTNGKKYKILIEDREVIKKIFDAFSCDPTELKKRINMGNLQNLSTSDEIYDCCNRAFLRGAFLSCGTITDPNKNYHLEFVVPYKQLSLDLQRLLKDCEVPSGIVNRRGVYVVYVKHSTDIENLLNLMGAPMAELEFINIKVQKSVANKINRANNFEYANISRTAGAAAEQLMAIKTIRENKTFEFLDEDLKQLASFREENPDASLTALGNSFDPPVSRSSVNYKFKKLREFAKKTRKQILAEMENQQR